MIRYFLFFFISFGAAAAQDIPLPLLESDRKSCRASCVQSYSGKQCTRLCDCTISAFKKQVNFDLYLQLTAEVSQNKLSKKNAALMDAIANSCSAKIFNDGPQLTSLRETAKAAPNNN